MTDFLKNISKHNLALLILVAAVLFVVLTDPPATVCGTQADAFAEDMRGVLTKDPKKKLVKEPKFVKLVNVCKGANSVGGCYPVFLQMRKVLERANRVSLECVKEVGGYGPMRSFMMGSIQLMTRLAWGEEPPKSEYEKNAWFEPLDLALYCSLQKRYMDYYGEEAWATLREGMLTSLPKAKELGREKTWRRSVLSTNCSLY